MVTTTRYSVIFQKFPSRVRVAQKNPSSVQVPGTRWGLAVTAVNLTKVYNALCTVHIAKCTVQYVIQSAAEDFTAVQLTRAYNAQCNILHICSAHSTQCTVV